MLKLTHLRLKNFRVFSDLSLPIKPINILTGPNSSGKSSIVKALLLLQDNLTTYKLGQLDFTNDVHRLGSFESVKTRGSGDDLLEFELEYKSVNAENKDNISIFREHENFVLKFKYLSNKTEPLEGLKGLLSSFELVCDVERNEKQEIIKETPIIVAKLLNGGNGRVYNIDIKLAVLGETLLSRGAASLFIRNNIIEIDTESSFNKEIGTIRDNISPESFKKEFTRLHKLYDDNFHKNMKDIKEQFDNEITGNEEIIALEQDKEKRLSELDVTLSNELEAIEKRKAQLKNRQNQLERVKNEEQEIKVALQGVENQLGLLLDEDTNVKFINRYAENSEFSLSYIFEKMPELADNKKEEILKLYGQMESYKSDLMQISKSKNDEQADLELDNSKLTRLEGDLDDKRKEAIRDIEDQIDVIKNGLEIEKKKREQEEENTKQNNQEKLKDDYYLAIIAEQIERHCFSKESSLTYSLPERKDADLMSFIMSNDWEAKIQNYVTELQHDKFSDVFLPFPDFHFLKEDEFWNKSLGDVLKDSKFNQITTNLIAEIRLFLKTLLAPIPFTYTAGIRGLQQRLYNSAGVFDLDKSIARLLELQNQGAKDKLAFINTWLTAFEIGDSITAVQIDGSFIDAKINDTTSVADMGLGVSQLLPIIITAGYYLGENYLVVLEEPCSHLHPKLQSKLADFMVAASAQGVQFMVETHSVYFIRKLEVLIVENELKVEKLAIYFINSLDKIKDGEKQLIEISVSPEGDILENEETQKYWKDFYDEGERLKADKDRVSKFKQNLGLEIKCLVLTEDKNWEKDKYLQTLLVSCGFIEKNIKIESYDSCDKISTIGMGMAKYAETLPHIETIIFHQDADGLHEKRKDDLNGMIRANSISKGIGFITKYNSIEGYFLDIGHITMLYPEINKEELTQKIKEKRDDFKNDDLKRLEQKFNKNKDIVIFLYDKNPSKYCDAKKLIKKVNEILQNYAEDKQISPNPSLLQKSKGLIDEHLSRIAQQIWGNSLQNP